MCGKSSAQLQKYQPPERATDDCPNGWVKVALRQDVVVRSSTRDTVLCGHKGVRLERFKSWQRDKWVYWWTLNMNKGQANAEYETDHSSMAAQPPWDWVAGKIAEHEG